MDCPMKYKFYFDYFKKHFNLVFERPRTDVYGVCKELKVKRSKEKKQDVRKRIDAQLQLHKKQANVFMSTRKKAAKEHKNMKT